WRNPSGTFSQPGYTTGCGTSFTVRTACVPGSVGQPDQAFKLLGNADYDNKFTIGKAKLNKKKGTATLPVTVPNPGTLAESGKSVKAAEVAVGAAGDATLPVKPAKKTKKKLKKKGKAKANYGASFTPPGEGPTRRSGWSPRKPKH